MLYGDISKLARLIGVSRQTLYNRAKRDDIDLSIIEGRCIDTVDMFGGKTIRDEHSKWFHDALEKLRKPSKIGRPFKAAK